MLYRSGERFPGVHEDTILEVIRGWGGGFRTYVCICGIRREGKTCA